MNINELGALGVRAALLLKVGAAAVEHQKRLDELSEARGMYLDTCFEWKEQNGLDPYERLIRESPQWNEMRKHADRQLTAWKRAKSDEYNARRRVKTAVRNAPVLPRLLTTI